MYLLSLLVVTIMIVPWANFCFIASVNGSLITGHGVHTVLVVPQEETSAGEGGQPSWRCCVIRVQKTFRVNKEHSWLFQYSPYTTGKRKMSSRCCLMEIHNVIILVMPSQGNQTLCAHCYCRRKIITTSCNHSQAVFYKTTAINL